MCSIPVIRDVAISAGVVLRTAVLADSTLAMLTILGQLANNSTGQQRLSTRLELAAGLKNIAVSAAAASNRVFRILENAAWPSKQTPPSTSLRHTRTSEGIRPVTSSLPMG
jgi:hypothetical protein